MKVFLHYEDSDDPALHKTLKMWVRIIDAGTKIPSRPTTVPIYYCYGFFSPLVWILASSIHSTLPKSWKSGPTSQVLEQFVESYNATTGKDSPLVATDMHMALRESDGEKSQIKSLASDAVVIETIPDRGDVYIMHGPAQSLAEIQQEAEAVKAAQEEQLKNKNQISNIVQTEWWVRSDW